ncbi:MAG: YdcF family protein, partial [Clostridia bacterium]|nr:YdcF family protein [Clostridia bacterium]
MENKNITSRRKLYFIAAAVTAVLTLIFRFISVGMGFTAMCTFILTVILIIFGSLGGSKAAKAVKKILSVILAIILIFAVITEIVVFSHAKTTARGNENIIIILGAGLHGNRLSYSIKSRLDRALEYLDGNKSCKIIVSGGKGGGESVTEAYAMKKYLVENGISPERITLEEESTTTKENLKFSKKIIDEIYRQGDKIAILSSGYHLYRTSLLANEIFGDEYGAIRYISARTRRFIVVNYYLREIAAV